MDESTENSSLHENDESSKTLYLPESHNIIYFPGDLLKKIMGYLDPYDKINFIKISKEIYRALYHTLAQDFITLKEVEILIQQHYSSYLNLYMSEKSYYDSLINHMWGSRMGPIKEFYEKYAVEGQELITQYQKERETYVVTFETLFEFLDEYKDKSKTKNQPFTSIMQGKSQCYKACSLTAIKMNTLPWAIGMSSFMLFLFSIAGIAALSVSSARGTTPSGTMHCHYPIDYPISYYFNNSFYDRLFCERQLNSIELVAAITLPFAVIIFGCTAFAYCVALDLCDIRERFEKSAPLKHYKAQAGQIKNLIFHKAKSPAQASVLLQSNSIFKSKNKKSSDIAIPINSSILMDGKDKDGKSEESSLGIKR